MLGHHDRNPYFRFTDLCNADRPVVILASGQACVWYHLALASKDGDWIAREDTVSLKVVLGVLDGLGARYRLGAPLDVRWLSAGWSSHFEARADDGTRLRFDFVTRPPRLDRLRLEALWSAVDAGAEPVIPRVDLIRLKQTMRLKDYAFIGSLALQLDSLEDQIRWTLDANHLLDLLQQHPALADRLAELRPSCADAPIEIDALDECLDRETRLARRADEHRVAMYTGLMEPWAQRFRQLELASLPLVEAHRRCCEAADGVLPQEVDLS